MRIDPVEASSYKPDFEPGVYLAEIKDSELKHGQNSGDPYFGVKMESAGLNGMKTELCRDVIMLKGKGARMGVAKLRALGFFEGDEAEDIEASQLVGRRCWVRVDWQHYEDRKSGEKRKSLKPVGSFDPFDCGFYHEDEAPADAASSTVDLDPDSGTPF